jgi:predicted ribosomally synthesized peptide with nif11-like leader
MSVQGVTAFWERIQSDERFRERIEQAATPQEKHQVLVAAGYEVSRGDLDTLRSLAGMREVSDEDLEKVAGGGGTATGIGWGGSATVAIGGAAMAAAIV